MTTLTFQVPALSGLSVAVPLRLWSRLTGFSFGSIEPTRLPARLESRSFVNSKGFKPPFPTHAAPTLSISTSPPELPDVFPDSPDCCYCGCFGHPCSPPLGPAPEPAAISLVSHPAASPAHFTSSDAGFVPPSAPTQLLQTFAVEVLTRNPVIEQVSNLDDGSYLGLCYLPFLPLNSPLRSEPEPYIRGRAILASHPELRTRTIPGFFLSPKVFHCAPGSPTYPLLLLSDILIGASDPWAAISDTLHRDAAFQPLTNRLLRADREADIICKFKLTSRQAAFLDDIGLAYHKYATENHPHPVHKALENNLLHYVVPPYLNRACRVFFLKDSKFQALQRRCLGGLSLENPVLDVRDDGRYLTNRVDRVRQFTEPLAFLHDAGHYLTASDAVHMFQLNSNLETLLFTAIIPPELVSNHPSYFPELYDVEYRGEEIVYRLEGHSHGAYTQPKACVTWLKINQIRWKDKCYTVQVLQSNYAHHLIAVSLHSALVPKELPLALPSLVELPSLSSTARPLSTPYVPSHVYKAVIQHALALKSYGKNDAWARIRQMLQADEFRHVPLDVSARLATIAVTVAENSSQLLDQELDYSVHPGWLRFIRFLGRSVVQLIPTCVRRFFYEGPNRRAVHFQDLIFREPARLTVRLTPIDVPDSYTRGLLFINLWMPPTPPSAKGPTAPPPPPPRDNSSRPSPDEPLPPAEKPNRKGPHLRPHYCSPPEPATASTPASTPGKAPSNDGLAPDDNPAFSDESKARPGAPLHEFLRIPDTDLYDPSLFFDPSLIGPVPYPAANDCLLVALSNATSVSRHDLWRALQLHTPAHALVRYGSEGGTTEHLQALALVHRWHVHVDVVGATAPDLITEYGLLPTVAEMSFVLQFTQAPDGFLGHWQVPAVNVPSAVLPEFTSLPWTPYTVTSRRAQNYVHDLKYGVTGTLLRTEGLKAMQAWDSLVDNFGTRVIQTHYTAGAAGCGKSTFARQVLGLHKSGPTAQDWRVVSPRVHLREEWKEKMKLPTGSYQLNTFESNLKSRSPLRVLDEITLFPPGWTDLAAILDPSLREIIMLGDPCQGQWHEPRPDSLQNAMQSESSRHVRAAPLYRLYTYRLGDMVSDRLGIPNFGKNRGAFVFIKALPDHDTPVVVSSTLQVKVYSDMGYRNVYTHTGCEGMEFNRDYVVVADSNSCEYSSDENILTAVTRGTRNVLLWLTARPDQLLRPVSLVLRTLLDSSLPNLDYAAAFNHRIGHCKIVRDPALLGGRTGTKHLQAKYLDSDLADKYSMVPPSLRAALMQPHLPAVKDPKPQAGDSIEPLTRTHFTQPPPLHSFLPDLPARESRELMQDGLLGAQFAAAETATDIPSLTRQHFPSQRASKDETLFRSSVKKRLRFASPESNEIALTRKEWLGPVIFDSFHKFCQLPLHVDFDPEEFYTCIAENERVKLESKSIHQLLNNAKRSDPSWALNQLDIFIKSQDKVKLECMSQDAKAGQTLATCSDLTLLSMGPISRYLTRLLKRLLPPNIYIHGGESIDAMASWSKKFTERNVTFYTNDFTAFDQSQGPDSLAFEVCLMRWAGIPESMISHYCWLKCNAKTQLGNLTIMRLTGEFCTYLFNTLFNIGYSATRFELQPDKPHNFSGDDSVFHYVPVQREAWSQLGLHFLLVGKPQITNRADFCGWILTPDGVIRHPLLLALKIELAKFHKKLPDVLNSYFIEALQAHNMGDRLTEWLYPDECSFQAYVMRQMVLNSKHLINFNLMSAQDSSSIYLRLLNRIRSTWKDSEKQRIDLLLSRLHAHPGEVRSLPKDLRKLILRRDLRDL